MYDFGLILTYDAIGVCFQRSEFVAHVLGRGEVEVGGGVDRGESSDKGRDERCDKVGRGGGLEAASVGIPDEASIKNGLQVSLRCFTGWDQGG